MSDPIATLREALADRYAIRRELGAGGMATVYLAEDLKHRRQVAVKVLRPELAAVLGPDRFLREIEIAARLQHPHILPLFDSGHASGFLYYVMPYVEGESLRGRLVREGALPIPEAARILRDVADALAHAHARGVVHRDIKPENVMLSGRHALVTDFGVAKAVSEASGRQQLTTAGVALGTPAYMAPEQAAADPNMDHRVDVYALGVVAYELLTGRPPFEGGSPQETLAAHVTKAPQPVSTHRSTVPPVLAQLVMKCLEKRPADRCQKADELVGQLEGFTTPSGGITPTDTRPISAIRNATLRPAAIVTVLGLLALGLYAWGPWRQKAPNGLVNPKSVRVAVLPLENRGRLQDEYFADGITEAIHGELSRVKGLTVIGMRTVARYKGSRLGLKEIGDSLNVDYVLAGTIQWDGVSRESSKVLVNPELVRVSDEATQWQDRYDRVFADVFGLQAEIAGKVAGAIRSALAPDAVGTPDARSAPGDRPNPEAYTLYLKGIAEARRSGPGFPAAVQYFRRATQAEGTFAAAWSGLASVLAKQLGSNDAKAAALKALSLDSTSAEAYEALASLSWYREWSFERADSNYRRAIRLDPNSGIAIGYYALFLTAMGRYDEALTLGRRAAELDPLVAGDVPLFTLLALGRNDEVISSARAHLALDSADTPTAINGLLGSALIVQHRYDEGLEAIQRSIAVQGSPRWRGGWAWARAGRTGEARVFLGEARQVSQRPRDLAQRLAAYDAIAGLYANLGAPDSAFVWLDRMVPLRGRRLTEVRWRPEWEPLRSDPRFKELLRKIGLEK